MTASPSPSLSELLAEIQSSLQLKRPPPPPPEEESKDANNCDNESDKTTEPKTTAAASPILALYFASAWCDDCQASHEPVTNVFQSLQQQKGQSSAKQQRQLLVDLVYVSSDSSSEELESNLELGWHYLPFEKETLRSNIKRHFGICAKKEMESLGITAEERNGGIPTLILVDAQKQKVIHQDSMPHVMGGGGGDTKVDDVLSHWEALLLETKKEAEPPEDGVVRVAAKDDGDEKKVAAPEQSPANDEKDAKKQKVDE